MENPVYMDHNATTDIRPEAKDAIGRALELRGNASSVHRFGQDIRRLVEDSREAIAELAGARPAGVVFTSGGTEANTLAIQGAGRSRVLASAIEHSSVLKARPGIEEIPVDAEGLVDLRALDRLLAEDGDKTLVSVMLANNETGVIQPLADVAAVARKHGALVHSDAVQAAGKIDIGLDALGADMVSLSAHKFGGPMGAGALVIKGDLPLAPVLKGGGQERNRRAGTENVPGIAGFAAAAKAALAGLSGFARLGDWRDRIEKRLGEAANTRVFGLGGPRLANTSFVTMPGVNAETQVIRLDLAGVAVSDGSACSSGKVEPSHVLAAMGVDPEEASQAIRFSLGWNTTEQDVQRFEDAWINVCTDASRGEQQKNAAAA